MNAWKMMPRALRRKAIAATLRDSTNVPDVRRQLAMLKTERAKTMQLLQMMNEAIEDTEALLGEVRA